MSASFPNAKKTFTPIVDGVTYVEAINANTAYDEIEAMQTMFGAMGVTQGYTESLKNALLGYRRGCQVEFKSITEFYVRTGEIAIKDASGNLAFRRNTSDITVTWTSIDTGGEATSTTYYVYAVADAAGTTFTVKFSTNATTPAGCTFYALLGFFYNNSGGDIENTGNLPKSSGLGNWAQKSGNVSYLALTDGFVVAFTAEGAYDLIGYTDASDPPTTVRAHCKDWGDDASDSQGCITMPVRKGDYWKTTGASTIWWISLS